MIEFAPRSVTELTYNEAILYCQFLEYNGHSDWRMPTEIEYHAWDKILGWYHGRISHGYEWQVVPVRDVC